MSTKTIEAGPTVLTPFGSVVKVDSIHQDHYGVDGTGTNLLTGNVQVFSCDGILTIGRDVNAAHQFAMRNELEYLREGNQISISLGLWSFLNISDDGDPYIYIV